MDCFSQTFSRRESIELLLDIGEEMIRGGHELPNQEWFVEMARYLRYGINTRLFSFL